MFLYSAHSWTRGPVRSWWLKSPWTDQKSGRASASSFHSVGWRPFQFITPCRLFLSLEQILGIHGVFPTFRFTICNWDLEFGSLFVGVEVLLGRWFFENKLPTRRCFPLLKRHKKSSFQNSHRDITQIQAIFQVELSFQIDEDGAGLVQKSVNIQPVIIGALNGSPKSLSEGVFAIFQEVLKILANADFSDIDFQDSLVHFAPSSDRDVDDETLGKLLAKIHRDYADYRCPVVSVSHGRSNGETCEKRVTSIILVSVSETCTVLKISFL